MDSKDIERRLAVVGSGRQAELAYSTFHEFIAAESKAHLEALKNDFRGGKLDPVAMASRVAAITALDDLDKKIEARIRAGRAQEKAVYDSNGTK